MEIEYTRVLNKKGRWLVKILRHAPKDTKLDKNGWTDVQKLLEKVGINQEEFECIIENNNKKRIELNEDGTRARACQGHSIGIDLALPPATPPDILYHGTTGANVDSIMERGLGRITRDHIHLSHEVDTATNVGSRHGKPHILTIDAKQMYGDGCVFYFSTNGVWLTNYVAPKYIK